MNLTLHFPHLTSLDPFSLNKQNAQSQTQNKVDLALNSSFASVCCPEEDFVYHMKNKMAKILPFANCKTFSCLNYEKF